MADNTVDEQILQLVIDFTVNDKNLDKALQEAYNTIQKRNGELETQLTKQQIDRYKREKALRDKALKQEKEDLVKAWKKQNEDRIKSEKAAEETVNKERKKIWEKALSDKEKAVKASNKRIADDEKRAARKTSTESSIVGKETTALDKFGKRFQTIGQYTGVIAIFGAVREAALFAFTAVRDLEVAFTDLSVKSGFSRTELNGLNKDIIAVAQSTKYSTIEIAGAATELAKMGFSAAEISNSLQSVAQVAAATGESLESTALILGQIINSFDMESKNMTVIADQLMYALNTSALDLEKFTTAFSYVGAVSDATNTSFEEMSAAMAVLSDRGITASKIGTGLRNVFTQVGKEGESLRDIIARINDEQMSFYEIKDIVGKQAANQLFILANSEKEFLDKIAGSQNSFGAAAKASAEQMDTFKAKWELFVNSVRNGFGRMISDAEDWQTAFYDSFDLLDAFAAEWGSGLPVIERLLNQYPELIKEFEKNREYLRKAGEKSTDVDVLEYMIGFSEGEYKEGLKNLRDIVEARSRIFGEQENLETITKVLLKKERAQRKDEIAREEVDFKNDIKGLFDTVKNIWGAEQANLVKAMYEDNSPAASEKFKNNLLKLVEDAKLGEETTRLIVERINRISKNWSLINKGVGGSAYDVQGPGGYDSAYGLFSQPNLGATKDLYKYSNTTVLDGMKKAFQANKDSMDLLKAGGAISKANENNLKRIKELRDEREQLRKEACEYVKEDPAFQVIIDTYGFKCPEKSARAQREPEREYFKKNLEKRIEFEELDAELEEFYKHNRENAEEQFYANQARIELLAKNHNFEIEEIDKYIREKSDLYDKERNLLMKEKYLDEIKQAKEQRSKTTLSYIQDRKQLKNKKTVLGDVDGFQEDPDEKELYGLRLKVAKKNIKNAVGTENIEAAGKEYEKIVNEYYVRVDNAYKAWLESQVRIQEMFFTGQYGEGSENIDAAPAVRNVKMAGVTKDAIDTAKTNDLLGGTDSSTAVKNAEAQDRLDRIQFASEMGGELYDIYEMLNEAKLEQLQEQADRELEIIQERHDREVDIINGALQAGVISQEDAIIAEENARKRAIDKQNAVGKKLHEESKKIELQQMRINAVLQAAQAFVATLAVQGGTIVGYGMAAVASAVSLAKSAVAYSEAKKKKFVPVAYAEGGMVEGKRHSEGGVPFSVKGQGGYEMEGGEYIVNREATKRNLALLEAINGKTKTTKSFFADGGKVVPSVAPTGVDLSKEIITALNRPVRAYVTNQDLAKSETERRALETKTRY